MIAKRSVRIANALVACATLLSFNPTPAEAPDPVFGEWLTDDHAAIVAISRCGERLCGSIERVLDPRAPKYDINNPDPSHRSRPLAGTFILWNYVHSDSGWKNGRAYDPKSGNSYRSTLKLAEGGRLEVKGCVLFICQSRFWTRVD